MGRKGRNCSARARGLGFKRAPTAQRLSAPRGHRSARPCRAQPAPRVDSAHPDLILSSWGCAGVATTKTRRHPSCGKAGCLQKAAVLPCYLPAGGASVTLSGDLRKDGGSLECAGVCAWLRCFTSSFPRSAEGGRAGKAPAGQDGELRGPGSCWQQQDQGGQGGSATVLPKGSKLGGFSPN